MSSNAVSRMGEHEPKALHAVARLRDSRLTISTRPFLARGGPKGDRCVTCRLRISHCICSIPVLQDDVHAGVCLLMHDSEPLKPSNTGWLIADVVPDTYAFGWSRTQVDDKLLELLNDPQWQPLVVFPSEYVKAGEERVTRVVHTLESTDEVKMDPAKRPLFVLLDATWSQARKMFHKSPYLDRFPMLSLQPEQVSAYRLRRSYRDDHFCTSQVAALCLELSGDRAASEVLASWLDVFTHHYEQARNQVAPHWTGAEHQRLNEALGTGVSSADSV